MIVVSSAIKDSNPEIIEAKKRNVPIVHRSQILEALMNGFGRSEKQTSIGVSGTHGKTTISGMASLIFEDAGLEPSFVVGGQMPYLKTNSKVGKGKHFIAELDESDGTIEFYTPDITVISNLEFDHPDHYKKGLDQLIETFENYVKELKPDSKLIINADCIGNRQLLQKINHPGVILYSIDENNELFNQAKYTAKDISINGLSTTAKLYKNNELVGEFTVSIPGIHNASNALAAIAAAIECNIEFSKITPSIARFKGMKRRFQVVGSINNAQIVDDYAHHPTEVKATLKAAKDVVTSKQSGRVIVIFQPHRYSRLQNLWKEFIESFKDADIVYLCDVYPAGEDPIENINSVRLKQEIVHNNIHHIPGKIEEVANFISSRVQPGDLVLTMGAGDITKLGNIIVEK
jgi:UDP-N-acetylmuramate--alanine ligase